MAVTEFVFHSGLDTIGAVVLEIRYGQDRVFFEAGTAFNPSFDMFDGKVQKRSCLINDYLWISEIPMIDGIYKKEEITNYDLLPASQFKGNQAFFITHLHLDHMRMMGLIDQNVDVYLTEPAQRIEYALEDVGLGVDTYRHNYLDIPDEVTVGQIKVKKFIINDDSYQDLSFYIETPDLHIHYTGDVFAYGKYADNLRKETAYLNQKGVDVLFCEGTQFWGELPVENFHVKHQLQENPETDLTKEEFDQYNIKLINDYPGLVILNYYEREMSDVMDYERIAKETGRTLVYEPRSAHIVNNFFHKPVTIMVPDNDDDCNGMLQQIMSYNTVITKKDVLSDPCNYIVQNTYENLLELLDYRYTKTMYLHHSGTPIGDFDPKTKNMKAIVNLCGFDFKSSKVNEEGRRFNSHATISQLLGYIDMVNAKLLVPCHSANRKAYVENIDCPYYWCNLKEVYRYNRENNTLEVIGHEK